MNREGAVRSKAVGLFALRDLLASGGWYSTAQLALELGVSARTMQRLNEAALRRWFPS